MTLREITSITATTDFHSSLDAAPALLAHLEKVRAKSLTVDCGDFFEGTGYYRRGGGIPETRILDGFYDVLLPGNHGWSHYLSPPLRPITVCANVMSGISTLFKQYFVTCVGNRMVGIAGVIGVDAFATIPPSDRAGQTVVDPAKALNALYRYHGRTADDWVLLSHSGFEHDLALAEACPWIDVIFSGHCHSSQSGPIVVGRTTIVKAPELGRGVAVARRHRSKWVGEPSLFAADHAAPRTARSVEISKEVEALTALLVDPCGPIRSRWQDTRLDRDSLASHVAVAVYETTGAEAALINHTSLRDHRLNNVLTQGDLMTVEPFDAALVVLRFSEPQDLAEIVERIEPIVGPLALSPRPLPDRVSSLATTVYLADTFLPEFGERSRGAALASLVADVLCERAEQGGSS
ncbi:5'-nucleotidase/UDP-sugar diphosphatase [Catenulispora sp. GAS73]|uniref:metallophosphoesterase n=1 Tax=Catenulispora sp. GAS73 TaxID=3156269 RepID=UPI003511B3F2